MKLLIVLLATIAFASAGKLDARDAMTRSAASSIVDALESLRLQMPCGFEKMGIPPLAPMRASHRQIAIETEDVSVEGEVNNLRVDGLDAFVIDEMKVNVVTSKVTFQFTWDTISIKSQYDLQAKLKSYGITVDIKGAGDLFVAIKNLDISGTVKYSLGLISKQIKLKELKIIISLGDVDSQIEGILGQGFINRKLNEVIEEMVLISINDNQEAITQTIEDAVLPAVNQAVDGMSLTDLILAVGGGSDTEPTVCIPPEDY